MKTSKTGLAGKNMRIKSKENKMMAIMIKKANDKNKYVNTGGEKKKQGKGVRMMRRRIMRPRKKG